jgi:hypothetical protein
VPDQCVNDQQAKWRIAPRLEDLAVVEALDATRFIGRSGPPCTHSGDEGLLSPKTGVPEFPVLPVLFSISSDHGLDLTWLRAK